MFQKLIMATFSANYYCQKLHKTNFFLFSEIQAVVISNSMLID